MHILLYANQQTPKLVQQTKSSTQKPSLRKRYTKSYPKDEGSYLKKKGKKEEKKKERKETQTLQIHM